MTTRLRLGLVSAARITPPAIIEPLATGDDRLADVAVTVLGARDRARAEDAASRWGVPTVVDTYSDVWTHPDVDAVYIATPAGYHHEHTLAALAAGRHVLCEKPIASNAIEAAEMVEAARDVNRVLMEAFHWRHHPLVAQMRRIIDSGELGDVHHAEARFVLPDGHIPRTDIRWDHSIGGGSLMDLGCYPVQWVRWLFGPEPAVTRAEATESIPGIDGRITAELAWSGGRTARVESSMIGPDAEGDSRLVVHGSAGTMTVRNPLAPQFGGALNVSTAEGDRSEEVDSSATYLHQLVRFRAAVLEGADPITHGADSIQTMQVIDEIYTRAGLGPRPSRH
ncbi:MAG: Gfo/Idh/MocA family protein [Ilumatobacteraceae bacterium]